MSQNYLESVLKKNMPANLHESERRMIETNHPRNPQPEAYWKKDAKNPTNWTCHFFKGTYAQEGARFACFNSMPSAVRIRGDSWEMFFEAQA